MKSQAFKLLLATWFGCMTSIAIAFPRRYHGLFYRRLVLGDQPAWWRVSSGHETRDLPPIPDRGAPRFGREVTRPGCRGDRLIGRAEPAKAARSVLRDRVSAARNAGNRLGTGSLSWVTKGARGLVGQVRCDPRLNRCGHPSSAFFAEHTSRHSVAILQRLVSFV